MQGLPPGGAAAANTPQCAPERRLWCGPFAPRMPGGSRVGGAGARCTGSRSRVHTPAAHCACPPVFGASSSAPCAAPGAASSRCWAHTAPGGSRTHHPGCPPAAAGAVPADSSSCVAPTGQWYGHLRGRCTYVPAPAARSYNHPPAIPLAVRSSCARPTPHTRTRAARPTAGPGAVYRYRPCRAAVAATPACCTTSVPLGAGHSAGITGVPAKPHPSLRPARGLLVIVCQAGSSAPI